MTLASRGNSASEKKLHQKTPRPRSAVSTRLHTPQHSWEILVTSSWELRPTRDFLKTHLQEPDFFGSRVSDLFLKRPILSNQDSYVLCIWGSLPAKAVPRKDHFTRLRSPAKITFKCLILDTPLWHGIMSTNLKNPKEQDDLKKGTLSNHPLNNVRHTHCTFRQLGTTATQRYDVPRDWLLNWCQLARVCWETHCKGTCSKEHPHIASGNVRGTYWNKIKCKERYGNPPETVIGQAAINLDSWVWKSLEDSLPELYCAYLAEAYVMRESTSLGHLHRKKSKVDTQWPNGGSHQKPSAKSRNGKEPAVLSLLLGSHKHLTLRKQAQCMLDTWGCMYNVLPGSAQGLRKRDKKLDSHAAKNGAKKLVSIDCAQILE